MNLMKLFNFKYLIQNIKKSKGALAMFLGLVPIFNFIMILMISASKEAASFLTLSTVTTIGMYVIPVVLSICLFGFVFKKKSVDFTLSMPLTRKEIFITNTVGGVVILLAMIIINVLLMLLLRLIMPGFVVPLAMIFDYLLVWSVAYIFVFTAANVAMCVGGNAITQIAVTALLLFLVPFVVDYSSNTFAFSTDVYSSEIICNEKACEPEKYYCYSDEQCTLDKSLGIYYATSQFSKVTNKSYTYPYYIFHLSSTENENGLFNWFSIIKTAVLSIAFFGIGLVLFNKKKMEVSETSFRSFHVHSIVKGLTMIPIALLCFEGIMTTSEVIFIVLMFAIMLSYFFIFDLITRRGIQNFIFSFIYFVAFIVLAFGFGALNHYIRENKSNRIVVADIKGIAVNVTSDYVFNVMDNKTAYYLENKELVDIIMSYATSSDSYEHGLQFLIKLKDGREYSSYIFLPKEKLERVYEILNADKNFIEYVNSGMYKNIYALRINDIIISSKKYQTLIDKAVAESKIEKFDFRETPTSAADIMLVYSYRNHNVFEEYIYLSDNSEVRFELIKLYNDLARNDLNKFGNIHVSEVRFSDKVEFDNCLNAEFSYFSNIEQSQFKKILKDSITENLDLNKPYVIVSFYNMDSRQTMSQTIYSNNVEEIKAFADNLRGKYQDDPEYREIMENIYCLDGDVQ